MVVGGLIPSYVSFASPETLVISSVSVQGIFDSIMPNILPLGFVFLLYWLFKKKNVNTMKLDPLVIALSAALSLPGHHVFYCAGLAPVQHLSRAAFFICCIVMTYNYKWRLLHLVSMVNFDEKPDHC